MTHWGRYWIKKKHTPRTLCSKLVSIDSFKLLQRNNKTGFMVQPFDINAVMVGDHLQITYRKRKTSSYIIPIDKQACHYGGFRYFFRCPLCEKRMRLLYFAQNSIFLCRKCLNLSYEIQLLRPTKRYAYISDKIKAYVKSKGGDLDRSKKPPRMHKIQYERLRDKEFYYESKSHQALNKDMREWFGVKTEPYLDQSFDYVDESKDWQKK